jgi:hypothetical protein
MMREQLNGHTNGHAPLDTVSDGAAGVNGHAADGRFIKGNRCAAGNPFARRVARLRSTLLDAVSDDDLLAVVRKLVDQAKGGDTAAAKLLLLYTIGKPAVAVDPDTLDRDEWRLRQDCPQIGDVIEAAGKLVIERAFIMLQKLEPGASHTAGATVVPLSDLLSEAAQQGAEPAPGPPPTQ